VERVLELRADHSGASSAARPQLALTRSPVVSWNIEAGAAGEGRGGAKNMSYLALVDGALDDGAAVR